MRVGLDHVHLFASDIAATVSFFERMFAATKVWDEDVAGARTVRLQLGHAFVNVYAQAPRAPRGGPMHHVGIATDDLDALVARMRRNGHVFRNAIRDEPTFRYVMTAGPDDLLLELFESREPQRWRIEA
jgi:catechol 2,3-dioxygenase-like lactoylglutathione lyase family enzyme